MSETQLSKAIQSALEGIGCLVVRVQSGRAAGGKIHLARNGTPDLWVSGFGWQGWLEVKVPGKNPNPEQQKWHQVASDMGVNVHVVRSVEQALRIVTGVAA